VSLCTTSICNAVEIRFLLCYPVGIILLVVYLAVDVDVILKVIISALFPLVMHEKSDFANFSWCAVCLSTPAAQCIAFFPCDPSF